MTISQNPNNQTTLPFLSGTPNPDLVGNPGFTGLTPYIYWNNQWYDLINQTFAHEGRMPPLVDDNRFDAQFGYAASGYYAGPYNATPATSATTTRRWSACGGSGIPGPPSTPRPRARG